MNDDNDEARSPVFHIIWLAVFCLVVMAVVS